MRELVTTAPEPETSTTPYALVQDVPASWEDYRAFAEALGEDVPDGLILHVAGRTDEGFRIIAVWESREARERFDSGLRVVERSGAEATLRELEVEHLLRGGRP